MILFTVAGECQPDRCSDPGQQCIIYAVREVFAKGVGVNFGGERGDKKCKLALIEGVTQNIFFYKNF